MQATSKFTRKTLSQIITVYQWALEVDLEEAWIKLIIRPNKDIDDMLDVINAELINVCWQYLEDKHLWLDKYQLATICAELTTLAMEKCEEPFRITVKTNKALIQEYLSKNKQKRETLERIKKENLALEKQTAKELAKREKVREVVVEEDDEVIEVPQAKPTPTPKKAKSKQKYNWDAYSLSTTFTF